jgi:hypothetical protein
MLIATKQNKMTTHSVALPPRFAGHFQAAAYAAGDKTRESCRQKWGHLWGDIVQPLASK